MILEEKKNFIINFTYFAMCTTIIYLAIKVAAGYLLPFIIAVIIACLVQKPAAIISKKINFNKQICAAILSVCFYIIFVLFILLLMWFLYTQSNKLLKSVVNGGTITYYIENLTDFLTPFFEKYKENISDTLKKFTDETVNRFIQKISNFLSNIVTTIVKKLPTLLISSVITIVATCYASKDFEKLKNFVKGFVSDRICEKFIDIKNIFLNCFFKFSKGYFWLFIISFLELLIGLMILRVSNFVIISILIAFVDLLPVFGTGIILLPWAVVEFFKNDYKLGFGLIILYVIIVVVRNSIEPKIIGKQVGINPLFTLIFIFLGLRIGGIIGMIVLPIVLTVGFTYCRMQIIKDKNI